MKIKRRDIFRLLDRDCVNPQTTDAVKAYIDRIIEQSQLNKKKYKNTK